MSLGQEAIRIFSVYLSLSDSWISRSLCHLEPNGVDDDDDVVVETHDDDDDDETHDVGDVVVVVVGLGARRS